MFSKRPIHVVIVKPFSAEDHYGPSSYLKSFVRALSKQPRVVLSCVIVRSRTRPYRPPEGVNVLEIDADVYSPTSQLRFAWKAAQALRRLHRDRPIDVLHCFAPNSSMLAAVLFRKCAGDVPILYDLRSSWILTSLFKGKIAAPLKRLYVRLAAASEVLFSSNASGFAFVTEALVEQTKSRLYRLNRPHRVIPNGVLIPPQSAAMASRSGLGVGDKDLVICYVGAVSKDRLLGDMVSLFAEATGGMPSAKLLIVGEGDYLKPLREFVSQEKLSDRVIFLGSRPQEEIPKILASCDWGISHLPSTPAFDTSFPMKVLEYRAAGLPVLAYAMPAHAGLAKQVPGIFLYKDAAGIRGALERGASDSVDLNRFSWETTSGEFVDFYEKLARQPESGRS